MVAIVARTVGSLVEQIERLIWKKLRSSTYVCVLHASLVRMLFATSRSSVNTRTYRRLTHSKVSLSETLKSKRNRETLYNTTDCTDFYLYFICDFRLYRVLFMFYEKLFKPFKIHRFLRKRKL